MIAASNATACREVSFPEASRRGEEEEAYRIEIEYKERFSYLAQEGED